MRSQKYIINLPLLAAVILVGAVLLTVALCRAKIDTDIVSSLPQNDPVISDARQVILNHPMQDRLVIDLSHQKDDPDMLVSAGEWLEARLEKSGLFREVGMKNVRSLIPELMIRISANLPLMFTEKELDENIRPLLEPEQVRTKLEAHFSKLLHVEGIGQARFISEDPLDLRNFVMARLSHLAPSKNAIIYNGHLLSKDGRHLLLVATPSGSATDTRFARNAVALFRDLSAELNREYAGQGYDFILTPVGAYRAALDNEQMAKKDTQQAILFSTIGIALLLIFAFPRPLIGLLSLLPAIAGTLVAFFVYTLLHPSISILTLGFGGAIISITVDHGIAYLLFLDRPHETSGREAAKEVWAVGLLATLTTVGAFASLSISGFPILAQIGQFAALGIASSFVFVHTIFPLIFPAMPPAKRVKRLPLQGIVDTLALGGGRYKLFGALALACFMLFFAKPVFHVDLKSMNSVSRETIAAEKQVADVWGNVLSKIFLMTEGEHPEKLQEKGDQLAELLEEERRAETLASAFVPSMIFPGAYRAEQNLSAWKSFWNEDRIGAFQDVVGEIATELGFAPDAFDPFYQHFDENALADMMAQKKEIPERFFDLLGISQIGDSKTWAQFSTFTPGKFYDAQAFYSKYSGMSKLFDPRLFSEKLGKLLFDTFIKMVLIIGVSVTVLLSLFFRDWKLTLITLMPIAFAFVCTLGTLKLIGHPLDLPGLMLSIVVMGMGIDYAIFFVRSYQRYPDKNHASVRLIRMAVFMASASTMIGFGVLNFADHALLRSAGITSVLGIFYALMGAFAILPPILERVFDKSPSQR